jgi:hypothetical protein
MIAMALDMWQKLKLIVRVGMFDATLNNTSVISYPKKTIDLPEVTDKLYLKTILALFLLQECAKSKVLSVCHN